MKNIFFLILFGSLSFPQSDFLDIKFYDSNDREQHTLNLKTEIDILTRLNSEPYLLLFVTNSSKDIEYKKQLKNLTKIDADRLQLLFVNSNAENIFQDGYHTDKKTALMLLGREKKFKIFLLDGKGKILFSSNKSINEKDIKEILHK